MQEKDEKCLTEGVTLSGAGNGIDCKRIALRRSPVLFSKRTKDAEGVKPRGVNLSVKRTEKDTYPEIGMHSLISGVSLIGRLFLF